MRKRISFILIIITAALLFYKCSSSEQSSQSRNSVGENIPPGSAIVLCTMNNFTESGDFYLIDVNVKSVIGYGSATDEIVTSEILKLQIAKRLIEIKSLKKGVEFKAEIKQPKMKIDSNKNSIWTVSQIMK